MPPVLPIVVAERYRVGELLGRGGMGEVRAATDEALDRPVAVKFLRADLADQPGLRGRFEREARAAARVSHPNVVAIYDIGEHEDVPFIVMERLSGRTLADEFADGAIDEPRALTLAAEILAAVAAAHRLGVIHRDIKPGNILLTDDDHAKVGDFGIAKLAEDLHHTTTGLVFGTASYLAPERLAGQPASPASDVYSVGVVLFEAVTGRPAFSADTPLALAMAVAADDPTLTVAERAALAPTLVAAIERAMAKDPAARFESADAMLAALDAPVPDPSRSSPTVPMATPAATPPPTVPVATGPRPVPATVPITPMPIATPAPTRRLPSRRSAAVPAVIPETVAELEPNAAGPARGKPGRTADRIGSRSSNPPENQPASQALGQNGIARAGRRGARFVIAVCVAIASLGAGIAVAKIGLSDSAGTGPSTTSTTRPTSAGQGSTAAGGGEIRASIPARLRQALEDLDRAVDR